MIPLLVNRYYLGHDLCHPAPTLAVPNMPNKHSCKQAYVLASILTGIVQLVTLLVSPLVGFVASSPLLSRKSRNPQAVVLAVAFLLGTFASTGFGFLPGGDPRQHVVVVFVLGLGIAQAAGTVVSLALVTKGRGTIVAHEGREVGGSLSSAYSFCGGESMSPRPPLQRVELIVVRHRVGNLAHRFNRRHPVRSSGERQPILTARCRQPGRRGLGCPRVLFFPCASRRSRRAGTYS